MNPSFLRVARVVLAGTLALVAWLALPREAHAQALHTWVSGVGDDANPCSRTAPCKTFAGAITKTAANGSVSALDPGDFGAFTIDKSVTIDGHAANTPGGLAHVSGATVTAAAADAVVLRGLQLEGDGTGSGVSVTGAGALLITDCQITSFADGVVVDSTANVAVVVEDSAVYANQAAGIKVQSTALAAVTIARARFEGNAVGLSAGDGARVSAYDASFSHNEAGAVAAGSADVNLERVTVSANTMTAIEAKGDTGKPIVRASHVLATSNGTSVAATGGGRVISYGNNQTELPAAIDLSSSAASQTTAAGGTAKFPLAFAGHGFFSKTVTLGCSGLPIGASCTFAPQLELGIGQASVEVSVATTARTTLVPPGWRTRGTRLFFAVPFAIGIALVARRKHAWLAGFALAFAAGAIVTACGGDDAGNESSTSGGSSSGTTSSSSSGSSSGTSSGSSSGTSSGSSSGDGGDGGTVPGPTPAGSYPFSVTATSGPVTKTLSLTLVVE